MCGKLASFGVNQHFCEGKAQSGLVGGMSSLVCECSTNVFDRAQEPSRKFWLETLAMCAIKNLRLTENPKCSVGPYAESRGASARELWKSVSG